MGELSSKSAYISTAQSNPTSESENTVETSSVGEMGLAESTVQSRELGPIDDISITLPEDKSLSPTDETIGWLQVAFNTLNDQLFTPCLSALMITVARTPSVGGYFGPRFFTNSAGGFANEISLNPTYFAEHGDLFTLSVLAHEMCHGWIEEYGPRNKNGKGRSRGYHCKAWAAKMVEIGLHPTDNDRPDGKMTGYAVRHLIVEGGPFERVASELIASGFKLEWQDNVRNLIAELEANDDPLAETDGASGEVKTPTRGRRSASKPTRARLACPSCDQLAWAKHSANLVCGACNTRLLPCQSR